MSESPSVPSMFRSRSESAGSFDDPIPQRSFANRGPSAVVKWQLDSSTDVCMRCRTLFGLLVRKHHCRACGQIVCDDCSQTRMPLPHLKQFDDVRVCTACVAMLALQPPGPSPYAATYAAFTSPHKDEPVTPAESPVAPSKAPIKENTPQKAAQKNNSEEEPRTSPGHVAVVDDYWNQTDGASSPSGRSDVPSVSLGPYTTQPIKSVQENAANVERRVAFASLAASHAEIDSDLTFVSDVNAYAKLGSASPNSAPLMGPGGNRGPSPLPSKLQQPESDSASEALLRHNQSNRLKSDRLMALELPWWMFLARPLSDEGCALGVGDLRVRIIQADQLPLLDFFPSSADPYLVARLGNYQWRSTTQNNTIEPVWDEECIFPVHATSQILQLAVLDRCPDRDHADDLLGYLNIPLTSLSHQTSVDDWFDMVPVIVDPEPEVGSKSKKQTEVPPVPRLHLVLHLQYSRVGELISCATDQSDTSAVPTPSPAQPLDLANSMTNAQISFASLTDQCGDRGPFLVSDFDSLSRSSKQVTPIKSQENDNIVLLSTLRSVWPLLCQFSSQFAHFQSKWWARRWDISVAPLTLAVLLLCLSACLDLKFDGIPFSARDMLFISVFAHLLYVWCRVPLVNLLSVPWWLGLGSAPVPAATMTSTSMHELLHKSDVWSELCSILAAVSRVPSVDVSAFTPNTSSVSANQHVELNRLSSFALLLQYNSNNNPIVRYLALITLCVLICVTFLLPSNAVLALYVVALFLSLHLAPMVRLLLSCASGVSYIWSRPVVPPPVRQTNTWGKAESEARSADMDKLRSILGRK